MRSSMRLALLFASLLILHCNQLSAQTDLDDLFIMYVDAAAKVEGQLSTKSHESVDTGKLEDEGEDVFGGAPPVASLTCNLEYRIATEFTITNDPTK